MQRRTMRRITALAVTAGALVGGPAAEAATTRTVGTPSATCAPTTGLTTIQQGVDASAPGDTVKVCSGTYPESVTVEKTLTLQGPRSGTDARTRSTTADAGSDAVVNGGSSSGFTVRGNGVTIDGFAVTGTTGEAGITLDGNQSGARIQNNLVRDNTIGLFAGGSGTVVTQNSFVTNNAAGSASGSGIYSDTGTNNVTVSNNTFRDNQNAGVLFGAGTDTTLNSNLTISGNRVISATDNDQSTGIYLSNVRTGSVTNNDVGPVGGTGVFVSGSRDLTIQGNNVHDVGFSAVRIAGSSDGLPASSGLQVNGNTLSNSGDYGIKVTNGEGGGIVAHFNRIVGNNLGAITNGTENPELNAENNFFGSNSGPQRPPCSGGSNCQAISANVDADPFLVLRVDSNPTQVTVPGSSTITASFLTNSDGQTVSGASAFPATRVFFTKTSDNSETTGPGTLSNSSAVSNGGRASVTLTSSETGTTLVRGSVDDAADTATVKFVAPTATPRDCNALIKSDRAKEADLRNRNHRSESDLARKDRAREKRLAASDRAKERRLHGSARARQIKRDRAAEQRLAKSDKSHEAAVARRYRAAEQSLVDRDRAAEQDCFAGK